MRKKEASGKRRRYVRGKEASGKRRRYVRGEETSGRRRWYVRGEEASGQRRRYVRGEEASDQRRRDVRGGCLAPNEFCSASHFQWRRHHRGRDGRLLPYPGFPRYLKILEYPGKM